ncbi:LysR family transcriptional regulator [Ochrobactrum sp. CM-21-5]|nr:LysR substrate-binding domain-containing protein [Ochrobactrum sp. CM-21-5]MBC2885468.1 LysR family transcriptional regulator [Ochrobactrum sp. CM-21-5]
MNLRSLDLNLLVILDALLDEAHVSRAANRLGLSQPAASAALQRCRHLFRDELLERGRGVMRLTPKAESLRAPLKALLIDAVDLIDPPDIPLKETQQTIRMTMADYPAILVVAPLLADLAASAPGINIVVQPWRGVEAATRALVEGDTDMAVSVFPSAEDHLDIRPLTREDYAVVMRADHPAAIDFDLDRWLAYPHVVVSGRGETRTPVDVELSRKGLKRRIGLVVPSFGMVPPILRTSSMIAALPSRVLAHAGDLVSFPPPMQIEGFALSLAVHRRRARDRSLNHVTERLTIILR